VAVLLRYKWLIVLTTIIGIGAGVVGRRYLPPEYQTQARIWAEVGGSGPGPIGTGQLLQSYAWLDLLKSFAVLDEAVRTLRLYVAYAEPADSAVLAGLELAPSFHPGKYELVVSPDGQRVRLSAQNDPAVDVAAVGDSIGRPFGFLWKPEGSTLVPGRSVKFVVSNPRDAAGELRRRLVAQSDPQGNFLAVMLSGRDPVKIAGTLNVVADRFVELAGALKRVQLTERAAILRDQLRDAALSLDQAEEALQRFKIETVTLPAEQVAPRRPGLGSPEDPSFSDFFGMRVNLDNLKVDRDAIERVLTTTGDSGVDLHALELIGTVQQTTELPAALTELTNRKAELRGLESQYTAEHPAVRRLAGQIEALETQTIPELASDLVRTLNMQIGALQRRTESRAQEMRQIPPQRIQEARLQRNVTIAENLYTTVQRRYEEANLAEVSSIPDVRVLEPALVPGSPVSDRGIKFLLLAIAAGFGGGVAVALLLDFLDSRVRYPADVAAQMGLQILGVVPHVSGARNGRAPKELAVVEALRGVRLNVSHAYGAAGPMVFTITSAGSGDGKSFIAANLGLAFADTGKRTLLIDGDSRRGALHRVIGASRKPGLMDVLSNGLDHTAAIQNTNYPGLHFLAGGTRLPGAPELLGSDTMVRLLAQLRAEYDVLIVDSPPLGAGVDAYALGTVTGSILFVIRTGRTDRAEAEAKLDVLDRLPVRVIGAVLNDTKDPAGYGYGYYSYYMSGYDFVAEEEDEEVPGLIEDGTKLG
jgi:capsular exopolysaccharide synthesis family protein